MSITITINLSIIPEKQQEFLALVKDIAPDTRAYQGCISFSIFSDQNTAGSVLFHEEWESAQDYEKYSAWRKETGLMETMAKFLLAAPTLAFYDRFDG